MEGVAILNDIALGTKLILKPHARIKNEPDFELASCLEAVADDNCIVIQAPFYNGTIYPLSAGEVLLVHLTVAKKGRYDFQCAVVEQFKSGRLDCIKAKIMSDIDCLQRRGRFRVKTSLAGLIFAETKKSGEMQHLRLDCLCVDISVGGACILLNHEGFSAGDNVAVSLPVKTGAQVEIVPAEIRWVHAHNDHAGRYKVRMGVKFNFIPGSTQRDTVTRYVAQCQQQTIKKKY